MAGSVRRIPQAAAGGMRRCPEGTVGLSMVGRAGATVGAVADAKNDNAAGWVLRR
jgi:hypothetical protein